MVFTLSNCHSLAMSYLSLIFHPSDKVFAFPAACAMKNMMKRGIKTHFKERFSSIRKSVLVVMVLSQVDWAIASSYLIKHQTSCCCECLFADIVNIYNQLTVKLRASSLCGWPSSAQRQLLWAKTEVPQRRNSASGLQH